MPAVWNDDDFTENGLASVSEFVGRLIDVEEDVEGKFGDQLELHFEDVEIIEAADDVTLDEGRYTSWVKQSNKKNSTNGKMYQDWILFAKEHDMGPLPSCFYGVLIRWEKATYEFGEDMDPGRALIPVELIDEGAKSKAGNGKAGKATKAATPPPPEEHADEDTSVPEELVTVIHGTIGEEGATKEMIRRALSKKAKHRTLLSEAGGLEDVLEAMDTIEEDDGTYTRVEEYPV